MLAREEGSGIVALEAPHTSGPAFDPTMVLFKTIVQVGVGSMADRPTQHGADRPGIGAMAIGGHPVGAKAHGRFGRSEERLGRLNVAVLAEHRVDQVAVAINRPVKVAPPATDL
jgi:hypothetical protein